VERPPDRFSRPGSFSSSLGLNNDSEIKKTTELVRHSSELSRQGYEPKHSELIRKHSDSSKHSERNMPEKIEKPTAHSTNLGNPEKLSFAKPVRPAMEKVVSKNERHSSKPEIQAEYNIGWRSDLKEDSRINTDLPSSQKVQTKKENNIDASSPVLKEIQELRSTLMEIQSDFQLQIKTLQKELDEEKQARIKMESEVKTLRKLLNK